MPKVTRHLQDSPETIFRRQVLERLAIALAGLVLFGIVARYLSAPIKLPQVLVAVGLTGLILLTPVLARRVKHAALAALPICVALLLLIIGAGWKHGGLAAPVASLLPMLPLVAFCFGGRRLALAMLLATVATTCGLFFAGASGWVEPVVEPLEQSRNEAIVFSTLAVAAFVIGAIYERSRRIAEQHLVEASRLASLGVMASGVAHEINNPLMIADSFARFLLDQAKKGQISSQEVERLANHVVSSTTRMAGIVAGLRIYSRDDAREELSSVPLERIVDDTLALCRERFRSAGIDLQVASLPGGVAVMARPVQVSQILLNVLNNAFDAVATSSSRWVRVETYAEAGTCGIRVVDSGPGVAPALRAKIFIPFFTTKPVGKGVGLGLSVCASIMSEHGGEVVLDAEQAQTTFVLRFPLVSETKVRAAG